MTSTTVPGRAERRARVAVSALFFTNGAIYANVIPRFPEIKAALGMSDVFYGVSVAAVPLGALLSGLAAATLIRRFGSARLAAVGSVLLAFAMLAVGLSPAPWAFLAALFVVGLLDSVTDVAQNAHGLRVQRRYGRSILNSFHAIWSLGAVAGGLMATAAIALALPLGIHLAITAVLFSTTALVALRFCLPGPDETGAEEVQEAGSAVADAAETAKAGIPPRLVAVMLGLALIAIAGTIVEDVGNSWATLYLGDSLGAPAALAATGYLSLIGFQFLGRIVGDRMVDRFGQRAVARAGGVLVALGMGLALAFPSIPSTLVGFAAAGFGVATLVPATMAAADRLPGLRPGTGLTVVTWLMRLGFLVSPIVIGAVSEATELRGSLLIVPLAGILVIALSGFLPKRR
ncbi:MFS transporter [Agromyces seonyuensis]|uniref:MFS transporter n=1 Tax=Agromyces seonyuensis TaxID=2662446 RepID=A0A6I4NXK0_9MICO|nr:MFS transporter [Agromyces seonyuensis]MWB97245.1 MFS transporter [Agromyces seonyuensis]